MTKDEIIELAREALKQEPREDWNSTAWVFADETLQAFAVLVASAEREACAKMCEGINSVEDYYGERPELICAEAIRRRGQA